MREHRWFALMLFGLACVLGALLGLLVLLAPWLARSEPTEDFWQQVLDLFARDVVVRRVSVASALGLVVTAFIFFHPGRARYRRSSRRYPGDTPPTSPMAGA